MTKSIFCFSAQSLGTIICPSYAEVTQCQEHASCAVLNDTHQCVCDTGFFAEGNQCLGEYSLREWLAWGEGH